MRKGIRRKLRNTMGEMVLEIMKGLKARGIII
jgi:hypothetical protein